MALFSHFKGNGSQLPARRQPVNDLALEPLVIRSVVLLANQQRLGGQQALQLLGVNFSGRCSNAGAQCQWSEQKKCVYVMFSVEWAKGPKQACEPPSCYDRWCNGSHVRSHV